MRTSLSILMLLTLFLLTLTSGPGQQVTHTDRKAALGAAPGTAGVERVRSTTLQREIRAVVDSARVAELDLVEKLGSTASPDHPDLQRHRRETTLRLLGIQARHAAARGQFDLERRIRANMAVLRESAPHEPGVMLVRRDG